LTSESDISSRDAGWAPCLVGGRHDHRLGHTDTKPTFQPGVTFAAVGHVSLPAAYRMVRPVPRFPDPIPWSIAISNHDERAHSGDRSCRPAYHTQFGKATAAGGSHDGVRPCRTLHETIQRSKAPCVEIEARLRLYKMIFWPPRSPGETPMARSFCRRPRGSHKLARDAKADSRPGHQEWPRPQFLHLTSTATLGLGSNE
jgi:hypothetical protein